MRPSQDLRGPRLLLRAGRMEDVEHLHRIRGEPFVAAWWGAPDAADEVAALLMGDTAEVFFVIELGSRVIGGIQYVEENEPDYRHAGIDLFLSESAAGQGLGREAVTVLATWLTDQRGHHRLTIDPSRDNERAYRCYASVGFRPVGVLREYERGPDGEWRDGILMDLLARELVRLEQ